MMLTIPTKESLLLDGLRVLVVDGNLDSQDLLTVALVQEGAEVMTATCVQEALAIVSQLKPDILLSELKLPQEDGYTLIQQLRSLQNHQESKIPAIATTVCALQEDRNRALAAGFQKHLAKPFDLNELVSLVSTLTQQQISREAC